MQKTGRLVYRAHASSLFSPNGIDKENSILTFEKPDDVDEPCGELVKVDGKLVYAPYGPGGFFYLSPFTNRWE